jgi:hypothetical protein
LGEEVAMFALERLGLIKDQGKRIGLDAMYLGGDEKAGG